VPSTAGMAGHLGPGSDLGNAYFVNHAPSRRWYRSTPDVPICLVRDQTRLRYGAPVLRAEPGWCAWIASGSLEVPERTVAATLFAARAPIPQGTSGMHEEARRRIEITRVSV
jgi:hypothetical protein